MSNESAVPHFNVERRPSDPVRIDYEVPGGAAHGRPIGAGLSQLIAISPAPDSSEFALALPHKNVHLLELLKTPEESALVLVAYIEGQDEKAEQDLDTTIKNIDLVVNSWENPDKFLNFIYSKDVRNFSA